MFSPRCRKSRGILWAFAAAAVTCACQPPAGAQIAEATVVAQPTAVSYGPEVATRYRFGAKIVARDGAVERIKVLMAVPLECPEQSARLIDEDVSPLVEDVEYRQTDEGAQQMVITVRQLAPGQSAHAYATFEVQTRTIAAPRETAALSIPKGLERSMRRYIASSPMIDVNDRRIRAALSEAMASLEEDDGDLVSDWQRVEAIYDYALKRVSYQLGDDKSSVQALKDGVGDCQAIAAVFVAMCRTLKVPARMVWVDGHQYAEFYLESPAGKGCWYPVESAGTRAFGSMPLARVILQKGDNISVPERPGERLRYASDYALFLSKPTQQPAVTYVRERVQ